jgi:hypothetical protein
MMKQNQMAAGVRKFNRKPMRLSSRISRNLEAGVHNAVEVVAAMAVLEVAGLEVAVLEVGGPPRAMPARVIVRIVQLARIGAMDQAAKMEPSGTDPLVEIARGLPNQLSRASRPAVNVAKQKIRNEAIPVVRSKSRARNRAADPARNPAQNPARNRPLGLAPLQLESRLARKSIADRFVRREAQADVRCVL